MVYWQFKPALSIPTQGLGAAGAAARGLAPFAKAAISRRPPPDGVLQSARAMTDSDFMLTLYEPDIPQNCGTMLRACACLGVDAAIIEPAGFPVSDRHFRRAGMDYLDLVRIERHVSFDAFETWRAARRRRLVLLTTAGETSIWDFAFRPGDVLMVGRESAGVPAHVHARADARLLAPLRPGVRSLNVAVAASLALGEALRQARGFCPKDQ